MSIPSRPMRLPAMRMPRLRFTIRGLMLAVAIVALAQYIAPKVSEWRSIAATESARFSLLALEAKQEESGLPASIAEQRRLYCRAIAGSRRDEARRLRHPAGVGGGWICGSVASRDE